MTGEGSGRMRRAKRDEVRTRILEAAYAVFAEKGYESAGLERIAEAAGFSKGAVYSNFANKDDLFFALISARIDERLASVRTAETSERLRPRRKADTPKAIAKLAGTLLRELGEGDPVWQMMFIEFWLRCVRNDDLREKLAQRRRAMRTKIAEYAESQAARSGIGLSKAQAMDLATTVLALSNGLGIEGLIDPKAVRPALLGELLSRIVSSGAG
jgi:AcrR family transcriptional regulator